MACRTLSSLLLVLIMNGLAQAADEIKPLVSFKDNDQVFGLAFTPDGNALYCGSGLVEGRFHGQVRLWDLSKGKEKSSLAKFVHEVQSLALSADGKLLAVGTGGILQGPPGRPVRVEPADLVLFDTATGKEKAKLQSQTVAVNCLAFSPDGKLLAVGGQNVDDRGKELEAAPIRLWDVSKGKEAATLKGHKGSTMALAFTPDGKRLASAGGEQGGKRKQPGEIKLWDFAKPEEQILLQAHQDLVECLAISPDGKRLASGSKDGTIKLWDLAKGQEIATLKGHKNHILTLAFSADSKLLASGSGDLGRDQTPGEVKLWDVAKEKELASLPGHKASVTTVTFDVSGKQLASAGQDGAVKVWDITQINK